VTFPFYNPVTVQDPTDDSNPTTKIYVDNGLGAKADSGHVHDARYSQLGHTHTAAAIAAGTLDIARIPTGTTSTTVPFGNDARFTDARTPTAHASTHASAGSDPISPADIGASATGHAHAAADVTSGTFAIGRIPTGTTSSTVAIGNDSRLSDARTPTAHAASHATGQADPIAPADIGASAVGHAHAGADITSGTVNIARIPTGTTGSTVPFGNDARFTDARTPTAHASTHASGGTDVVTPAAIGAAATSHVHSGADITTGTVPIGRIPTGTTGSTVPFGNDSRFTDARTPTAHAASHATGGGDAITPASIGASATGHVHSGADITSGTVPFAQLPTGTSSSTVAIGNHNHDAVYAALVHAHAAADVTSGTFAIGRIPTGTSGTTVALGNHVHSGADITSGTVPIAAIPTGTSGTTVAFGNHVHAAADVTSGTFAIGRIPTGTTSSTVAIGNDTRLSVKPYAPVTLTDQATVTTDASLGTHFRLTGTTARIIAAPTNPVDGQVITYEIKASSGALTHTWNAIFTYGSDVTALTAIAAGKTDFIQWVYNSSVSKWLMIGYMKGFTT
jgi:hypothetical protein